MIGIRGALKTFDWGDGRFIDSLLGVEPDGTPKAELWFGAHPAGPSLIEETGEPLKIEGFPFLLKVLAIGRPLSLQVHPSKAQAASGRYADRSQKAEVFCALSPSVALCGFLPLERIKENLGRLGDGRFRSVRGHREFFDRLAASPPLLEGLAGRPLPPSSPLSEPPFPLALELAGAYPGDIAAAAPLFLNTVHLAPGQALFVPPRVLHCYISGCGIELMNSSDNVLRAGLTSKHKDLDEVRRIAAFEAQPPRIVEGRLEGGAIVYNLPPRAGFKLARLEKGSWRQEGGVFRIVLCVEGEASVNGAALAKGGAVLVCPDEACAVSAAEGTVFVASEG